jgi:Fe-S-cluster containining protein
VRRQLPLFVERSIQQLQAIRDEAAEEFERKIVGEKVLSCTAGCASCCYHPVLITILEAFPLYEALVSHGHWVPSFREKLKKSSSMTSGLSFQVWLLSKIPCPLLKDNRCMAYESRPLTCRITFATGDAFYCDPQRLGPETTILPRVDELREFHNKEAALLRKHGLYHLTMPIGRALLLVERVCNGSIMLENVDRKYVAEYMDEET